MKKTKVKIYLGADHGGFHLKETVKHWLKDWEYDFEDLGNEINDPGDDYPLYALLAAKKVASDRSKNQLAVGIISCRTATGMAIVANKISGVRAVVGFDAPSVIYARKENDANVLALAGDLLAENKAKIIIKAWLEAKFDGGNRYKRRMAEIKRYEKAEFEIIPGILEHNFKIILKKIMEVEKLVDWIQVDVTDGKLVNNSNFSEPRYFKKLKIKAKLELHLMVKNPAEYVRAWTAAGFKRIIAQVEGEAISQFIDNVKQTKAEVGLAVDLPTPLNKIKPYLKDLDCVLLMGVKAGYSGQKFNHLVLKKITELREYMPKLPIEIDGGVSDLTAPSLVAAGATRLVTTSYLYNFKDILPGDCRRMLFRA